MPLAFLISWTAEQTARPDRRWSGACPTLERGLPAAPGHAAACRRPRRRPVVYTHRTPCPLSRSSMVDTPSKVASTAFALLERTAWAAASVSAALLAVASADLVIL